MTALMRDVYADEEAQDVTEIIGTGKVDMGYKAMIHTLAVRILSAGRISNSI